MKDLPTKAINDNSTPKNRLLFKRQQLNSDKTLT